MKHKNSMKARIICLAVVLVNTCNIARAQNTGPVAPEAMQFEPVDVTDMVNLATGDFTYVLPLLDIPAPGGNSFPLAINYHAGVAMDQEASWVGLGWNINPGAIKRFVNNAPDDAFKMGTYDAIYDPGGSFQYSTLDITVPYYNIGVSYTWGDCKGFGGSIGYGPASLSVSYNSNTGADVGVGFAGVSFSASRAGANFGIGFGPASVSFGEAGVGIRGGYGPVSVSNHGAKLSLGPSQISLGYDFRSGKTSLSHPTAGRGTVSQNPMPQLHTLNTVDFMNLFFVMRRDVQQDWFLYSCNEVRKSGALYMEKGRDEDEESYWNGAQSRGAAMDMYHVLGSINTFRDPNGDVKYSRMAFPAYDKYIVSSQGINGTMSPHMYEGAALVDNSRLLSWYEDNNKLQTEVIYHFHDEVMSSVVDEDNDIFEKTHKQIYFNFDNEYNSYLEIDDDNWALASGANAHEIVWSYINSGGQVIDSYNGSSNYVADKYRYKAGNHIEWITNTDIANGVDLDTRLFLRPASLANESRNNLPKTGIGAYSITTDQGVTYHYSLPVYQSFEYINKVDPSNSNLVSYSKVADKYAYTWLLTAITGPDFVDNPDPSTGESYTLGEEDFGYWVSFEYGKWTNSFCWKTPFNGYEQYGGVDDKYTRYGLKEIYYLDFIKTRTHTACFIKDVRADGKGKEEGKLFEEGSLKTDYQVHKEFDSYYATWHDYDKFYAKTKVRSVTHQVLKQNKTLYLKKIVLIDNEALENTNLTKTNVDGLLPAGELNVDAFELIENEVFNEVMVYEDGGNNTEYYKTIYNDERFKVQIPVPGGGYDDHYCFNEFLECKNRKYTAHFQDNVLDVKDPGIGNLSANALKTINFDYDYTLCPGTPNSDASVEETDHSLGKGKLTLKEIDYRGKNNFSILPPYKFSYYHDLANTPDTYDKDRVDDWGYDCGVGLGVTDEKPTHIWSLKNIGTPLGANIGIEYENDEYSIEAALGDGVATNFYEFDNKVSYVGGHMRIEIPTYYDINQFSISKSYTYELMDSDWSGMALVVTKSPKVIESSGTPYVEFDATYLGGNGEPPRFRFLTPLKATKKGGGLRVKSIKTRKELAAQDNFETVYDYEVGVTSYAPDCKDELARYIPFKTELPSPGVTYQFVEVKDLDENFYWDEKKHFHFRVLDITSNFKEYSNYTMGNSFSVETLQDHWILGTTGWSQDPDNSDSYERVHASRMRIHDNLSSVGNLMSVSRYNSQNEVIEKTTNSYMGRNDLFQGIFKETFKCRKMYRDWNSSNSKTYDKMFLNSSSRIRYSSALEKTVSYANGVRSETVYSEYDFNTGKVLKTDSWSSDGDKLTTEIIPAYNKYLGMGSKVDDLSYANMLTQETAVYVTHTPSGSNNSGIQSAGIQTWDNEWKYREWDNQYEYNTYTDDIWRKKAQWQWKGSLDALGRYNWTSTSNGYAQDFDWGATDEANKANGWQRVSNINMYNSYSVPLEVEDINGSFAATQMGYDDCYVLSTAANARYIEFAYSGAEDLNGFNNYFGSSEVEKMDGVLNTNAQFVHTGKQSLKLNTGGTQFGFRRFIRTADYADFNKKYLAQVWVHESNALNNVSIDYQFYSGGTSIDYGSVAVSETTPKFGNWYLLTIKIPENSSADVLKVFCFSNGNATIYLDDFRVLPYNAAMAAYVYDKPTGLVTAIFSDDHLATKYEYDDGGQLKAVYTETPNGFVKTSEHKYNYSFNPYLEAPDEAYGGHLVTCTAVVNHQSDDYVYEWICVHGESELVQYAQNGNQINFYAPTPLGAGDRVEVKCHVSGNGFSGDYTTSVMLK